MRQFEWASFVQANNAELLANLGNFVNRTVKFVNAKLDGAVPEYTASFTDGTFDFLGWRADVDALLAEYRRDMDAVRLRAAIRKAMEVSAKGNLLLQYRLDNANLAAAPARTHAVLGLALNLSLLLASLVAPYMPATAAAIARQLDTPLRPIPDGAFDAEALRPGHRLGKAEYLFTRIDEKKVTEWRDMFGGTQESRKAEAEAKQKKLEEKERKKAKKAQKKAVATVATGDVKELPLRPKQKPAET